MPTLHEKIDEKIVETTERIVIDYANLSGRESANRAGFRQFTENHLKGLASEILAAVKEVMKKMKDEQPASFTTEKFHQVCEFGMGYQRALSDIIKALNQ